MVNTIFRFVANLLDDIATKISCTYNEINIVVYYFLIPLSWTIMCDCILHTAYFTVSLVCIWVGILIAVGNCFRQWSDYMFQRSVDFLLWFNKIGWNYYVASVIICVVVPLIIYATLILLLIKM